MVNEKLYKNILKWEKNIKMELKTKWRGKIENALRVSNTHLQRGIGGPGPLGWVGRSDPYCDVIAFNPPSPPLTFLQVNIGVDPHLEKQDWAMRCASHYGPVQWISYLFPNLDLKHLISHPHCLSGFAFPIGLLNLLVFAMTTSGNMSHFHPWNHLSLLLSDYGLLFVPSLPYPLLLPPHWGEQPWSLSALSLLCPPCPHTPAPTTWMNLSDEFCLPLALWFTYLVFYFSLPYLHFFAG